MKIKKKAMGAAGMICLAVSFLMLLVLTIPTLGGQDVAFPSVYKEKSVVLKGTYFPAEGEYAALICPGYSCDRQKWRPFADLLVSNGVSTLTFDYSGQGASSGTIGFDNAKTDAIPVQIGDAIEQLHQLSGIDYDHILLVGHSMGGRSILRLMDDYNNPNAVTTVEKRPIPAVILMSPEVNYHYNAQASLFAGTSDESEEPWRSLNDSSVAGTDVYLYGSTADDIVSDGDVLAIYRHLGGTNAPASGTGAYTMENAAGSHLTVKITSGVLHSYIMYSPKFAAYVNEALTRITGQEARFNPQRMNLVYGGWALGLLGLLLTMLSLADTGKEHFDAVPRLTSEKAFLVRKLILWLPGAVAAFLICCVCVVMPFGSPVMNTPYMCFIAGYGLVMLLSYRKGSFRGTSGKLPKASFAIRGSKQQVLTCALVVFALCFYLWFVLRCTMYRLIPLNARLFWVAFAAVLMAVGYYVSGCESDMLLRSGASRKTVILYNLIQYVPLFLLVGFYLVLKSYSGMIGQMQNMVLMYIFCVPLGNYVRRMTGSRIWGAVVSAFAFQTLMITSAALIAMF